MAWISNYRPYCSWLQSLICRGVKTSTVLKLNLNCSQAEQRRWIHTIVACMRRHQMETFSALLALYEGNPPVTSGFPSQRPVTRNVYVFFICAWTNGWANHDFCFSLRGQWCQTLAMWESVLDDISVTLTQCHRRAAYSHKDVCLHDKV